MTKIIGSAALTAADPEGENLTTKGDLHGFSTENTRIPISTNNFVLTADSTQALGLKWAAVSGGQGETIANYETSAATENHTFTFSPAIDLDLK